MTTNKNGPKEFKEFFLRNQTLKVALGVGLRKPTSQPGVDLTCSHVVQLWELG